jgi:phosphate transport system permease protein
VVGVFVWAVVVRNIFGTFSGLAGGIALALIMIPIVTRTVEEMLRLVPDTFREAALGLGVSRAKTILFVVVPTAKTGIVTGIVLAVARAGGETAPLVLTALGNQFFNFDLRQPMAALPLQIYQYASSPYEDWHTKAWGSALVLILVIAVLSMLTRLATRNRV